ncbi:photosynthetic NDH subunit of lumenal location 3, chloroplastic-like [Zingiber officinale]|uniref:photosynthetic NDH subunit of lumenal location 3, chloroplastic-like n=1 Tax=Zingiber officinale TaxID=94328 RepID=UPI001C4BC667|nr:photosynthetic NDH subunit of lumenal location 3, chloroplastic-like [Zingiber officinale]
MAAPLSNLNATSTPPNLHNPSKRSPAGVTTFSPSNFKSPPPLISRRASLGLSTAVTLFQQLGIRPSTAAEQVDTPGDNGLWLTGPIPSPTVTNKIENKETGTRSFLRNGIFMAEIGEMTAYRLKHYAFDLLALADLIEQMDAWNYVRMYLCLRSTVMYYDFDKVISAAADDQKPLLTDLANRLFDSVEKLEAAVKQKSEPLTRSCYAETEVILKEVMSRMA